MPSSDFDFDVITGPSVPRSQAIRHRAAPEAGAAAIEVTRHVLVTSRLAHLPDRTGADYTDAAALDAVEAELRTPRR